MRETVLAIVEDRIREIVWRGSAELERSVVGGSVASHQPPATLSHPDGGNPQLTAVEEISSREYRSCGHGVQHSVLGRHCMTSAK